MDLSLGHPFIMAQTVCAMGAPLTEVLWRRSCRPLGIDDPKTFDGFAGGRIFAILADEHTVPPTLGWDGGTGSTGKTRGGNRFTVFRLFLHVLLALRLLVPNGRSIKLSRYWRQWIFL